MHYRVLILSLTCNIPYFRKLARVVKETWAKDVLDGKFDDCCWFAYTACDENHKEPCIDWNDHMIYVDCPDDRNNTFTKIQLTYQALKDAGITCDYILRTNVTTYVNLDLILPKIYELKENDILGSAFPWRHRSNVDGSETYRWNAIAGHCMCYPRKLWEIGMTATNDFDTIPTTDDVIISGKINEVIGWENLHVVNPNPDEYKDYPLYKPVVENLSRIIERDPHIVQTCSAILIKQDYEPFEVRCEKEKEIEYFYELYRIHKNVKKHYKVLFLSMSCNNQFFEIGQKVVHDTWAKPIIEGKYADCEFYSYTASTDGQTYTKEHCVYVDCLDGKEHTYSKTILALKYLQSIGITWDVIVRTNTSTYINIENTLDLIKKHKDALTSLSWSSVGVRWEWAQIPTGFYMIIPKKLSYALIENFNTLNEDFEELNLIREWLHHAWDDEIIGVFRVILNKEQNLNIPFYQISNKYCKHYKTILKTKYVQNSDITENDMHNNQYTNPNEINKKDTLFLRTRLFATKIDDVRYIEFEHMYEINEAKNGNKIL